MGLAVRLSSFQKDARVVRARPWLALFFLWFLFELPIAFRATRVMFSLLRPTAEMLAILTLGAASYRVRWGKPVRVVLALFAACLVIIRIDAMVFRLIVREDALLYDQFFMLRHTMVLVSDLWSPVMIASLAGGVVFIGYLIWLVVRLVRAMSPLVSDPQIATTAKVGFVLWLVLLPLSSVHVLGLANKPLVRWEALSLSDNITRSRATYRAVQKALRSPPYGELKKVRLKKKPDVLVFLVESYGRIMASNERMRPAYRALLDHVAEEAQSAGFHIASGYSRAPISGGRSWLAAGSIMMGTSIKYESVFHHLISNVAKLNTLATFFHAQGYETIEVLPADRARPGIGEVVNRYGFDKLVHLATFQYRGPPLGWGIVPDQYAVDFVDEHFLRGANVPIFMYFRTVSSHAPWKQLPQLVDDYRTLDTLEGNRDVVERSAAKEVFRGAARFTRKDKGRQDYMGKITDELSERYALAIQYSLEVIARFLARREKDALVIVMGDHQPPLISPDTETFDVPVHVFSKTPELLDEFTDQGFVEGMAASDSGSTVLSHAGLFTLVARALSRADGTSEHLPELRLNGVNIVR